MKYRLEFELNDLPKTVNQIGRSHWSVKAKEARKWVDLVRSAVFGKSPEVPLEAVRITLCRFSSRSCDPDGLVSSFKHVIDGLTRSGVIVNDTFEVISFPKYLWEKAPKGKGKIKVIVEEIDSAQETNNHKK